MCFRITAGISFGQESPSRAREQRCDACIPAVWWLACDCLLCALPPGTAGTTSSWHPARKEPVCQAGCPPAAASSWLTVRTYVWEKHLLGRVGVAGCQLWFGGCQILPAIK